MTDQSTVLSKIYEGITGFLRSSQIFLDFFRSKFRSNIIMVNYLLNIQLVRIAELEKLSQGLQRHGMSYSTVLGKKNKKIIMFFYHRIAETNAFRKIPTVILLDSDKGLESNPRMET